MLLFGAMLRSLHGIKQMKNSARNFSAMNSVALDNADKSMADSEGNHIVLSQIETNTLCCQQKELEDKGKSII